MEMAFPLIVLFFIFWIFSWSLDSGKQSKTPVSGGQGITEVLLAIIAAPLFVIGGIVYLLTRTIAETAPQIREHTQETTRRARHAWQRITQKRNRGDNWSRRFIDAYLKHATVYTADLEPQDAASHLLTQNADPSDIMRTLRAIGWSIRKKLQQH